MSLLAGVGIGVIAYYASVGMPPTSLIGTLIGPLIGSSIAVFLLRDRFRSAPKWVEPYYHPILGLWLALAAFAVGFLLTAEFARAIVFATLGGTAWALGMLFARLWRTRDDPPGHPRPVPTATGWRGPSKRL